MTDVKSSTNAASEHERPAKKTAGNKVGFSKQIAARLLFRPTLWWNRLLALTTKRRWWDRIDENVLLGALPREKDISALKKEGVGAVLDTCGEVTGIGAAWQAAGLEYLRVPMTDFVPPSLAEVEQGVNFVNEQTARGKTTYIHCKAGRGRSATVVLCWLLAAKEITPEEAEELIREKRPHIMPNLAERTVVREFYRRHADAARRS